MASGNAHAPSAGDDLLGSNSARVLAFGGILLIAVGMLFGDVFAIFILHPNNDRIGEAMFAAAQAVPAGDTETIMARFQAIGGFLENRGTKVDAHSHGIIMGYIALLLAILQPYLTWSERTRMRLAWFYTISAWLLPVSIFTIYYVGLAFSPLDFIGWASISADFFGFCIGLAVTAQLLGLWRGFRERQAQGLSAPAYLRSLEASSRILLAGGTLLLAVGFLYGWLYAGYLEWRQSPSEVEILKGIVSDAAAQKQESLGAGFAAYGAYQASRAIHVATHTHVNQMGILLLLLAFVQPFVFLSDLWKRRWAKVLVFGSAALPVCILMELRLGLIAGGMADFSGFLAICGLLAMLWGMVRQTGVQDSR